MKRKIAISAVISAAVCSAYMVGVQVGTPTPDVYNVVFDSRGGSEVESQRVERGDKVSEPPVPTKNCECEFDGWYVDGERWSFVGYVATEDMTLTAKWVECFGLSRKEKESLERYVGDWSTVANIEYEQNESRRDYTITLTDGSVKKYGIGNGLWE